MKQFLLFITCLFFLSATRAQGLKKYPISNSGCSLYMYCDPGKFEFDYSEDSSKVYTGECEKDGITYGVICIGLLNAVPELQDAEELMISYLDFLKVDFRIMSAAGYGKGHILNKDPNTRGVIDYWKDQDEQQWKVKGWTDGKFIGVLFAYSKKELPEMKVNMFLDGFRLGSGK